MRSPTYTRITANTTFEKNPSTKLLRSKVRSNAAQLPPNTASSAAKTATDV